MIKQKIFDAIIIRLQKSLQEISEEVKSLTEASNDAPKTKEDHVETTKTEIALMAAPLSEKVKEMREDLELLASFKFSEKNDVVSVGSLVDVTVNNFPQTLFILPVRAMKSINIEGASILPISKSSPIYNKIINKKAGESISLPKQEIKILKIQ
jgi:transcription elongation GreA/GreB family factor